MTTLFVPPPAAPKKEPRPYQIEAWDAMDAAVASGKNNTTLVLAPSGGKTFCAVRWGETRWISPGSKFNPDGGRCLWIAHREELLDQAAEDVRNECCDATVSKWSGTEKDSSGDFIVASNQSYVSLINELTRRGIKIAIIVMDEAHHAKSEGSTYSKIHAAIPHLFLLCLTGTPKRMDEEELLSDNIAYQRNFRVLAKDGWCARDQYIRFKTAQSHLFNVRAGEFTNKSLKSLNNKPRNDMVADFFLEHRLAGGCKCPGRKCELSHWPGVFYGCDVEHATELRDTLLAKAREAGVELRARVLVGTTPKDVRKQMIADFKAGRIDALVNVDVLTEGTDLPQIRSIHLCRPTASEVKWLQMALRGGRSKPGFQATGNDPTIGLHPDNHYYLVDYVDSVHHYVAASRGWALSHLADADEIKIDDDIARVKALLAELAPDTVDEFAEKQKRYYKTEDTPLKRDVWTLTQIGAVLISSGRKPEQKEEQRILTAPQDFALLCATEFLRRRLETLKLPYEEFKAAINTAISRSYVLFCNGAFRPKEWSELLQRFLSHTIFKKAKQPNDGRTWVHQSAIETPPLEEVHKVLDEIEEQDEAANNLFETTADLYAALVEHFKMRSRPTTWPIWEKCFAKVDPAWIGWHDRVLTVHYAGCVVEREAGWFEVALESALRHVTEVKDAKVVLNFNDQTYGPCPEMVYKTEVIERAAGAPPLERKILIGPCPGKLRLKRLATGSFYGCDQWPQTECSGSARRPRRDDVIADMKRNLK